MIKRTIDASKCVGCGLCVSDCINQYLMLSEVDGRTIASFKERGRCLECGHCNAICPQGAISGGKLEDVVVNESKLLMLMTQKRTVRQYIKNSVIPREDLDKIILAGQSAPTDRNRKSARIVLIKDALPRVYLRSLDYLVEEVQKDGTINPLYVPTLMLNEKREEILWNAEYLVVLIGLPTSLIDASICAERMQLDAWDLGIGTAYRGDMKKAINNIDELRTLLGIRSNEEVLISFAMGKTRLQYHSPAVKANRKIEYL